MAEKIILRSNAFIKFWSGHYIYVSTIGTYTERMTKILRRRRIVTFVTAIMLISFAILQRQGAPNSNSSMGNQTTASSSLSTPSPAAASLESLAVKGRASKTGYTRAQFGDGWATNGGCDTRNIILNRDLHDVVVGNSCEVVSGTLDDPYTGKIIEFVRGPSSSDKVQIDHVVALGNAWQTGAQSLTYERRVELANDPLELLAVDGQANQIKSDGDAATWLPSNKPFRCQYVARQIAVKIKYSLWVTSAEKSAMQNVLSVCPGQRLPAA